MKCINYRFIYRKHAAPLMDDNPLVEK